MMVDFIRGAHYFRVILGITIKYHTYRFFVIVADIHSVC